MCSNIEPKFDLHEGKIYKVAIDTKPICILVSIYNEVFMIMLKVAKRSI
jgi:hypothetical protein